MRRCFAILLLITVLAPATGSAAPREVYYLDRGWKFFFDSDRSSDARPEVNLPHTWNRDALAGKADYLRTKGNYQKEIEIPAEWSGRRIFVRGWGANTVAVLNVNGRMVGEHRGGYTAFAWEITDYVEPGRRNMLWIMVNNAPTFDVLPTAGEATSYGGLFRDVELVVTGREAVSLTDHGSPGVSVVQKAVSERRVEAEVSVRVDGRGDNTVQALVTLMDADMKTVANGAARVRLNGRETATGTVALAIDDPHLWNGMADPYMYSVGVRIVSGSVTTDSVVVATGFRTVSVDPARGFMLNGRPYKLRGVSVRQDRAMKGSAIDRGDVRRDIDMMAEMGVNMVRVAGVAHHPEFYRECDRRGIVVWSEFPLTGEGYLTEKAFFDSPAFRANGAEQATEIVRQQYNHPSVAMWGIFAGMNTRGDDPRPYIRELNTLTRRLDPSRPTVAMSNTDGDINFITDLICWDHHLGWREGYPEDIEMWKNNLRVPAWAALRSAVSYGAGGVTSHQEDSLRRPDHRGSWHPERWQTHLHEVYLRALDHETSLWAVLAGTMFDHGAAASVAGGMPGIDDSGLVTFDRHERKDAFYLYKANWNENDRFVHIVEKRWSMRSSPRQQIRVYSNMSEVELVVNGASLGKAYGTGGVFTWSDVELLHGLNTIEAHADGYSDSAVVEVADSSLQLSGI